MHYLLAKLYSVPDSGETPLNLSDEEHQKYVDVGHASFREFTRLLKVVENHTLVGPVPVGEETYDGLFVKNLKGSEPMEALREGVHQKFSLVLREMMGNETRENMLQELLEIMSGIADSLA